MVLILHISWIASGRYHRVHNAFLSSVRMFGRVHEGEMAAIYTLRSSGLKGLMGMAGMGLDMFRKGKVKILPHRPNKQVKDIFRAAERKG
jgi:heterodisulfide reductase subunit C